jgi:hypothetical protein
MSQFLVVLPEPNDTSALMTFKYPESHQALASHYYLKLLSVYPTDIAQDLLLIRLENICHWKIDFDSIFKKVNLITDSITLNLDNMDKYLEIIFNKVLYKQLMFLDLRYSYYEKLYAKYTNPHSRWWLRVMYGKENL